MGINDEMDEMEDRMNRETINSLADSFLNSLIRGGYYSNGDNVGIVDQAFDLAESFMAESIRRGEGQYSEHP